MGHPKEQGLWVKITKFANRKITIKERTPGGSLNVDFRVAGRRIRRSTGVTVAEEEESLAATAWVQANVPKLIDEFEHGRETISDVLDVYETHKLPQLLNEGTRQGYKRAIRHARIVFGDVDAVELGQQHIDAYEAKRKDDGVGPSTIASECTVLRVILNWCTRFKVAGSGGHTLLDANPLNSLRLPSQPPPSQQLTPVATQARFEGTLRHCMCIDPTGLLLVFLVIARTTARRFSAVDQLLWVHVHFTVEEVLAAAAKWAPGLGLTGSEWPYGALFWPAETDKVGRCALIPMTKTISEHLLAWRARCRQAGRLGRWVFPSVQSLEKPLPYTTISAWLRAAERHAFKRGEPTPPLTNGVWHPYRRLFRTERALKCHDKFTAAVGGWAYREDRRSIAVLNQNYLQVTPAVMYQVMDFTPATEVDFGHSC